MGSAALRRTSRWNVVAARPPTGAHISSLRTEFKKTSADLYKYCRKNQRAPNHHNETIQPFGIAVLRSSQRAALTLFLSNLFTSSGNAENRLGATVCLTGNCGDQGEWARRGLVIARAEAERELGKTITLDIKYSKGSDAEPCYQKVAAG